MTVVEKYALLGHNLDATLTGWVAIRSSCWVESCNGTHPDGCDWSKQVNKQILKEKQLLENKISRLEKTKVEETSALQLKVLHAITS